MLAARRFELVREVALSRERVWQILSHTDHLNRAVGLPAVSYGAPDANLRREAKAKLNGLEMRWKEEPFEWIAGQQYSVRRIYHAGPLREFNAGVELSDGALPATTRVRLWADLTPANFFSASLLPLIARSSLNKTWQYCRAALDFDDVKAPLPLPVVSRAPDAAQLRPLVEELGKRSSQPRLAQKLGEFLMRRGDDEVAQIKPFRLAAQWEEEREEVLRLCLHAVRAGVLNLSWNLMCPNCRVSKEQVASLAQLKETAHCDLCGVDFDLNFDRYVELRFSPHPSVRAVRDEVYCLAGPFLTPHVAVQKRIAPGAKDSLTFPDGDAPMRLRVPGANHVVEFSTEPQTPIELSYGENGWAQKTAPRPRAGDEQIIENQTARELWVVLEKVAWDDEAATAARVTAMTEFRRLFSSEALAPGRHVAVQNLTLLFSDLLDSTQLYEREGDAPAYGCVRRHFDFLFERIENNNGAVVKTIGDAVMAVFQSPEDALRAALAIQGNVAAFNASLPQAQNVVIKIGLHHGPAIVVNSNGQLDYFGRVVNIAARLGSVSGGGDIILSASCFENQNVRQMLRDHSASVENFRAQLKGIEGEIEVHRAHFEVHSPAKQYSNDSS